MQMKQEELQIQLLGSGHKIKGAFSRFPVHTHMHTRAHTNVLVSSCKHGVLAAVFSQAISNTKA